MNAWRSPGLSKCADLVGMPMEMLASYQSTWRVNRLVLLVTTVA